MKNFNKITLNSISRDSWFLKTSLLTIILLSFFIIDSYAQTICTQQTGEQGGFTYEYYITTGSGCMELGPEGSFSIEWSNVGNMLARKAKRPGSFNQVISYDVDYKPIDFETNSIVGAYGWTQNPLIEYYVIDNWARRRPTVGTKLGTITSDGGQYDLYTHDRFNKPSIEGKANFTQYWSIRKTRRTSGTITMANHFQAWENLGLQLGTLWEVSFVIEGLNNSGGFAEVRSMSMTEGSGTSIVGPSGYTYAANESETVEISNIPYDVAYGQDGQYEYLFEQAQDVRCDTNAFGNDPASGVQKYCFIRESKAPYSGTPTSIPGIIEAENYDHGGAARSYMDSDTENNGDVNFRENNGVDIGVGAENNGYAIGWTREGEWLEYTIAVQQNGLYNFNFSTASESGTGVLGVDIDGNTLLTGIEVPQTGGWDDYAFFSQTAELTSGEHILRFKVENGGFNLDKINISNNSLSTNNFTKNTLAIYPNPSKTGVFNLPTKMSFKVYAISGKLVINEFSNQVDLSKFSKGIYLFRTEKNGITKLINNN